MKKKHLTRRRFLGRLGAAGAAGALLPMIPLLHEERARASGEYPARLAVFYTPNGRPRDAWRPTGGERDFTLGRILRPLEPFRDRMVILSGVDQEASKHGEGAGTHSGDGLAVLTGIGMHLEGSRKVASGMSVDQLIAGRIGGETPFGSIQLGTNPGGATLSWSGPGAGINSEREPGEAFDRFFGSFDPSMVDTGRAGRERQRRILDTLTADVSDARAMVATDDRDKIDAHMASLEDIYDRLDELERLAGTCAAPSLSSGDRSVSGRDERDYVPVGRVMQRIGAAALTCDLTRVLTVQWGRFGTGGRVDMVGITSGDDYHEKGHNLSDGDNLESYVRLWEELYATEFRTFLEYLDSVPEPTPEAPDGTLLDNTLVIWLSSMASPGHGVTDMPYVLAGGRNLGLEGGRWLRYDGIAHNHVLVSLAQIMGLSDVDQFGDPDWGRGPLPGLMS